ncbi:uncharacterized protein LOC105383805 [Plutella xylostella]|uniref:uncharacterized protein LOC105383805 n=1 Tax=Plutella xylostella TaxID=51655 RepID=UPI002032F315|nr:uncharacterized protein LOC105383805 [Plutella xylostella]
MLLRFVRPYCKRILSEASRKGDIVRYNCGGPCPPPIPPQKPGASCAPDRTVCHAPDPCVPITPAPPAHRGPIPYNPCCPTPHHCNNSWKKYRNLFIFILLPLICIQAYNAFSHDPPAKPPCIDYEYMRRRTKRFPWGDGKESLFHNPHFNYLPGECPEPPPPDCD